MNRPMKPWDDAQHYVIVNPSTGGWVQQSHIASPRDLRWINEHEERCGRPQIYEEKFFTTEEIQAKNKKGEGKP